MSKHVIVPEPTPIIDHRVGKPVLRQREGEETSQPWIVAHEDFVNDNICSAPKMSAGGGNGIRRMIKLQQLFEGSRPGDVVAVEDADYKVVMEVLNAMEFHPSFARWAPQILPHFEAWEAADKQDNAWKKKRDLEQKRLAEKPTVVEEPPTAASA